MTQRKLREIIAGQKLLLASPEMTARDAVQWMLRESRGAVLVERGGRLIGIFTEHDALSRVLGEGRQAGQTLLHEVMTRAPVTLGAEHCLIDALDTMRQFGFRHVPVVDNERPLGVVSLRDILESDYGRQDLIASSARR
jgi:CBS domain-containing protein